MQVTGLRFGERFRLEFAPANLQTPNLGQVERDPAQNYQHPFDTFVKQVVHHLQEKGIPADTCRSAEFFDVIMDGKKDRTLTHQNRIIREAKAAVVRDTPLEKAAQCLWKTYILPRLFSLEAAEKQKLEPEAPLPGEGWDVEDAAFLTEMYLQSEAGKVKPEPWDMAGELAILREIRQRVEQEGVSVILTESVLKKLANHRRIPAKPYTALIDEEADFNAAIQIYEELRKPERFPLTLDYCLSKAGKNGSFKVGNDYYEFTNLPFLLQEIKRHLPNAQTSPFHRYCPTSKEVEPSAVPPQKDPVVVDAASRFRKRA